METKNGKAIPTFRVHFGYTDGISMTTIRGGPETYTPDGQQPCEPWLFVLRDEAENYFVPEPRELGLNGSFAVFKMIETDVVGFENFLQSNKAKIDPELLAAKLCGRSEEHTSELQSLAYLVCRLLLEKKKNTSQAR